MADDGISSVRNGFASGAQMRNAGNVDQATLQVLSSPGQGGVKREASTPAQNQTSAPRQVINIDGENLNRNARRGTYLNIVV